MCVCVCVRILTSNVTTSQSGPWRNDNEEITAHAPELQMLNLTAGSSLLSHARHHF